MTAARLVASFLGSGFAPAAPGTAGSLAALALGAAMLALAPWMLLPAALAAVLAGLWAVTAVGAGDDPGWVVIDEVAGQWLALLPLAHASPLGLALAFLLFRAFDILKPGPIGWADRQGGALGVMADDVLAGLAAAVLLWLAQWAWPAAFAWSWRPV